MPMNPAKKKAGPIVCTWEGDGFKPLSGRALDVARDAYAPGERVALVPYDQRSRLSHDHFFTCVRGYWQNWPEDYEIAIASEDQLRKHALIHTGHYDESACAFSSSAEIAHYITMMTRAVDYAEFSTFDNVVVVRIAKTQRKKLMGAAVFQQSKQDVLDFLAAVVGVDAATMQTNAVRHAA